jgi:hypothetical protein
VAVGSVAQGAEIHVVPELHVPPVPHVRGLGPLTTKPTVQVMVHVPPTLVPVQVVGEEF